MQRTLNQKFQVYVNVMETLVQEEIENQLKFYPENLKSYLNKVEVATYALNRLHPLYASSQLGKQQQLRLAKKQYHKEITSVVRRALAAIERDPLRQSAPLVSSSNNQSKAANTALRKLEYLLDDYSLLDHNQKLSWDNVTQVVQQALNKLALLTKEETELKNKLVENSKFECSFFDQ